jgi:hypothetical protein
VATAETTPREILALEKALAAAELRYQDSINAFRLKHGEARAVAAQFVRERRAERDALSRQLTQLRGGAR